ncbi:DUF4082 domain-containing protein [Flavobacterium sp.]|uniref:DUF4082 domain-containing protein n=1 Tax=Flavobacterium sp. TaxID=239 RepID=UPI003752B723
MKTIKKTSLLILFLGITLVSCNKDDSPSPTVYPEENFLPSLLSSNGLSETTPVINDSQYEIGISFKPKVNGKINAIVIKIPDVQSAVRVTIWDKQTATVIKTEFIDCNSAGVEYSKVISDLNVTKDKEYLISMNTNDYFIHKKLDNSSFTYPIISNNITITGSYSLLGALQTMPTAANPLIFFVGDLSFNFKQTE